MKKYYIDEKILSILFRISDKKVAEETFALFADILMRFHDELSREFLLERGINEIEVNEYLENENTENIKIDQLLESQEFQKRLEDSKNSFIKKIYDTYTPELSEEEKNELEKYNEMLETEFQSHVKDMNMLLDFSKTRDKFIQEGALTKESFDQMIDEEISKLGSTDETQTSEPTDVNQPVQSAPTDTQNTSTQVSQ